MRRIVVVASAVLGATVLLGGTANAASGYAIVQGEQFDNPTGCFYTGDSSIPLPISNQTETTLSVYSTTDCSGDAPVAQIAPGDTATISGGSVGVS